MAPGGRILVLNLVYFDFCWNIAMKKSDRGYLPPLLENFIIKLAVPVIIPEVAVQDTVEFLKSDQNYVQNQDFDPWPTLCIEQYETHHFHCFIV